jgi:predicted transcriptional regulator
MRRRPRLRVTSQAAYQDWLAHGHDCDARILRALRDSSGRTCAELEALLGLAHQTCSAEIRHLCDADLLHDSGQQRPTPSGRQAIVWAYGAATIPDVEDDGQRRLAL